MEKQYQLIKIENPFKRDCKIVSNRSILDDLTILDLYCEEFPNAQEVTISVNGKTIASAQWEYVRIKEGDEILVVPDIQGGGDGKNPLGSILMIVVAAVAIYTGQYYLLKYPGEYFMAAVITTSIMTVGSKLVNAIAPNTPPSQTMDALDTNSSQTYSWSPQTVQQQGIVIPRIYGLNKVYGNVITGFLESTGNNYTAKVLIGLGCGPINKVYDYKLNDQLVKTSENGVASTNFDGTEIYVKLGTVNQTVIPAFNDTKIEFVVSNGLLQYNTAYTYTTNGSTFDGLEIDVSFPQGLYHFTDAGTYENYSVDVKVEIKKQGDVSWTNISSSWLSTATVTDGEVSGRWSKGYWFVVDEDPYYIWVEKGIDTNVYEDHSDGEATGETENGTPLIWSWVKGSIYSTADLVVGQNDYATLQGNKSTSITKKFIAKSLPHGIYDIKVTRLTTENTDIRYGDKLHFPMVREVYYDDFSYPRIALVGIKSLATQQISGSLRFSCLVEGLKCRVYNSSTSTWSVAYTNNPAWVCWDILTQPVFNENETVNRYDGYNPAYLDLIKFAEWADWCDEIVVGTKRITFNGIFDSQFDVWAAVLKVCETGRAIPIWNGTNITIVIDKAGTETQLFTIGNIGVDSFKEVFLSEAERAGEIEIDFINSERDYEKDKYTLINTTIGKPSNKASIQLMGITSPLEAWRAAKYKLLCNQYLLRMIEFNADVDAIACTVGDIVRVGHSVPAWGTGGRVVSATTNTITLDQSVTIEAGHTYEILVKLSDDSIADKVIATSIAGNYTTLTISGTFATIPSQFDVFTFGETSISYKPFRIIGMRKTADLRITLTGIEYNELIYDGDGEPYIQPANNYSSLEPFVQVTNLQLMQEVAVDNSEALIANITAFWAVGDNTIYSGAKVYVREVQVDGSYTNWQFDGETRTTSYRVKNVVLSKTYQIGVLGINFTGLTVPFTSIVTANITIQSDPSFFSEFLKKRVSGLQLIDDPNGDEFDGKDCKIQWNSVSGVDISVGAGYEEMGAGYRGPNAWLKDYEVKVLTTAGATLSTHYVQDTKFVYSFIQNNFDTGNVPNASFKFEVKARSKLSDVSLLPARLTVTNTSPSAITNLTTNATVGGVVFSWDANTEEDLLGYYVRTKAGSGSFSSWEIITDNKYTRILTAAEITAQTNKALVYIEVQAIDVFSQVSSSETASAKADTISDNIFQLVATKSGGTGNASDLYDGNKTSGGVTI